jgi:branched-chain amino acid transport system ATP-binding protein
MPAHKRVGLGLSLVPEGRRLFSKLTVKRNLELGAYTRHNSAEIDESVEQLYALFPILKERSRQLAGTMSGGEQQMLAIARGLMARPELLMLDEPSWGVAPKFVTKIIDTIQLINQQGVSVLLVEQALQKALAIAHYGYVIQTGRIVMEGSGQELLNNEQVRGAYLGM